MQIGSRNLRRRITVVGLIVLALGIALITTLVELPQAHATPSGDGRGQSGAGRSAVPASAIPRLAAIAADMARANDDVQPISASAVATTHANALLAATPGDTVTQQTQTPVYLVVIRGHFTGYAAKIPPGASPPTGSYLSFVVDQKTFTVMDWGLSPNAPSIALTSLGSVAEIKL
jgi:hypothetical protein